jgi:hypothetical protein
MVLDHLDRISADVHFDLNAWPPNQNDTMHDQMI